MQPHNMPFSMDYVSRLSNGISYTQDAFNFRDLSMHKDGPVRRSNLDYFNMSKPIRGSSPTASLAADMSQNMHIDQRYFISN